MASNPTSGEYKLAIPKAAKGGGPGGPAQGGSRSNGGGAIGSSQSDSALPALLVGFVAIGSGGLAFVYLRRRRSGTGTAS